jgi:hypothetical protein
LREREKVEKRSSREEFRGRVQGKGNVKEFEEMVKG